MRTRIAAGLFLALSGLVAAPLPPFLPGGGAQGSAQAEEAPFTPAQREEVVRILREALRTDPTILRDAVAAMQQSQQAEQEQGRRDAIQTHADALLRDPADPVKGNPAGDLTVVEFFDPRCGYCKALAPTMQELLSKDGKLRVVMKAIPILGPNSVLASRALLAAQRQDRFVPLYDRLMQLRAEPTEAVLQAEAQKLGLDWARMRRDMDDPAIEARLQQNLRLAQALSIEGTPALVIGDTLVPGAVDLATLRRLVAQARGRG